MSSVIAAFAVLELPATLELNPKPGRKPSKAALDVQALTQSDCQLVGVSRPDGRYQLALQFQSVFDCVRAVGSYARSCQRSARNSSPFRVGIAVGEVRGDAPDLESLAIMRAQWLTTLSKESAVLLSESAAAIAQDLELIPYAVEEFGEFFNIQTGQTHRIFSLSHPEITSPDRIDDEQPRHNIPWLTDFFIGREADIEVIGAMLEHARYVRLIGPSGVGKSTLAKRVGLELVEQYRDGVKYVDLSQATDRQGMYKQVLRSVDPFAGKTPELTLDNLRRFLGNRHHLLILDGCDENEGLVEAMVNALLQTKRVQVLSTCINTYQTQHGVEYLVEEMPVPHFDGGLEIRELEGIDACALFLDGMRKYRQGVPPQDSEAPLILDLCRKTGGSPLALNLAARRLRFEPLSAIVSDYEVRGNATGLQPVIRNTLERLSPSARRLIENASSFQGPWAKSTLAEMMDRSPSSLTDDIESLQYLGLIRASDDGSRLVLASHFRDGIRADLRTRGDLDSMRESHLITMLGLFQRSIQEINGPNQRKHLDSLHTVSDDLEVALGYLIESRPSVADFIDAMRSLWPYWYKRNRLTAVLNLCDQALEASSVSEVALRQTLSMLKAIFLTKFGHADTAIAVLSQIADQIDEQSDRVFTARLLVNLGIAQWAEAKYEDALTSHTRASAIAEVLNDPIILLGSYGGAAAACICLERFQEAERWQVHLRHVTKQSEDRIDSWNLSMGEAQLAWGFKDYVLASQYLSDCLREAADIGDSALTSRTHLWKAQVEVSMANFEAAAISIGSCISMMNSDEHSLYRTNLLRIQQIENVISENEGLTFLNKFKLVGGLTAKNWL